MKNENRLSAEQVEMVTGGCVPNVANLTREEALKIAAELGEGENMGSWRTMDGDQFMEWWASMQSNSQEIE